MCLPAKPLDDAISERLLTAVTPPADAWAAPEGDYNLFLISDQGVPSVATSVRIVAQKSRPAR